jgi:hypothetical protein
MADKKQPKESPEAKEARELAEAEQEKLAGETDSQQKVRKYHEGKFQTHDPSTGEKRDKKLPQ